MGGFVAGNLLGRIGSAIRGKKDSSKLKGAGSVAQAVGDVDSYHKGGVVRNTGLARLKKGERVLTKAQQKKRLRGK